MWSPLWGGDIQWIEIRICSPSSSIVPSLGSNLGACGMVCVAPVGVEGVQSWMVVVGVRRFCCHMSLSDRLFVPGPACLFSLSSESAASHVGASYRGPKRQAQAERRTGSEGTVWGPRWGRHRSCVAAVKFQLELKSNLGLWVLHEKYNWGILKKKKKKDVLGIIIIIINHYILSLHSVFTDKEYQRQNGY